jgi:septal ring factor EnvC (AmiA/AmiB activator)
MPDQSQKRRRSPRPKTTAARLRRVEREVDELMEASDALQTELDSVKQGVEDVAGDLANVHKALSDLQAQGKPPTQAQLDELKAIGDRLSSIHSGEQPPAPPA